VVYLPFDRPVPNGSIADKQGQGRPHDCGTDKHGLHHLPPHKLWGRTISVRRVVTV